MTNTFHDERAKGIGGSDAAAVLGRSAHKTRTELWLQKRRLITGEGAQTKATERGHALESAVLDWYERQSPLAVTRAPSLSSGRPIAHREHGWMLARPDGIVVPIWYGDGVYCAALGGADAKTAAGRNAHQWGREGTDEIPEDCFWQGVHYMAVCEAPWWDFPVLIGGSAFEFRNYRVTRDEALIDYLVEAERVFWHDHVLADVPPNDADPKAAGMVARARHPWNKRPLAVDESPETIAAFGRLIAAEDALERATSEHEAAEGEILRMIGDRDGIQNALGVATWRVDKRGNRRFKLTRG